MNGYNFILDKLEEVTIEVKYKGKMIKRAQYWQMRIHDTGTFHSFEDYVKKYLIEKYDFKLERTKNEGTGQPDWKAKGTYKDIAIEEVYFEAKSEGDLLRCNQIDWIANHPNKKVVIVQAVKQNL